ncbi:MAG: DUF4124 domain-containing protein [Nitrospirota bacterium]|nr:MAG: DUF4124 domain-containing protein [Nitrospirota bacterium]
MLKRIMYKEFLLFLTSTLIAVFTVLIILSSPDNVVAGTLYKWTDHKGETHITDYPPTEGEARDVQSVEAEEIPEEPVAQQEPVEQTSAPPGDFEEMINELLRVIRQGSGNGKLPPDADPLEGIDPQTVLEMTEGEFPVELAEPMMGILGAAGTMLMIVSFAISLFINLYLMLCTYLIARKTGVSYAWMSWIPVLNIFPIFGAAGYSWWVGPVVLLLPLLLFIPVMLFPPAGAILSFLMAIGLIIFFIYMWTKICESLNVTKLAAILIIVPLFNFLIISYLAFKKETHLEGFQRLRPAIVTLIVFIVLTGIYSVITPIYIMPQMNSIFMSISERIDKEMTGHIFMPEPGKEELPDSNHEQ